MDETEGVVAIIPARGGSQRLPRKNLLPLGGKPLITWTIEAALASGSFRDIVVSSDDAEILAISSCQGVILHNRSPDLATATASSVDVLLEVLQWMESAGKQYRTCVLLQPTSPLRTGADITGALEFYAQNGGDTVVSVSELATPFGWLGTLREDGTLVGFDSLQGGTPTKAGYRLNGAIYIFDCRRFRRERRYQTDKIRGFVMPPDRGVDIDTHRDLLECEAILNQMQCDESNRFTRAEA